MGLIRARHNTVLQRLVRAIPKDGVNVFVEQDISPDHLRPDIVLHDPATKRAVVVDVTVPYESGPGAIQEARQKKLLKYAGLRTWMLGQEEYQDVTVHAFVVGSLGAWDQDNSVAVRDLGIRRGYTKLFYKLCVADAIKGSFAIWKAR